MKTVIVLLSAMIILASEVSFAETIEVKHIKTIKMEYTSNWYSYNYFISADHGDIPPFEIRIVSDLEQKTVKHSEPITHGNYVSFGTMIHSNNPDLIYTEVVNVFDR